MKSEPRDGVIDFIQQRQKQILPVLSCRDIWRSSLQ